MAEEECRRFIDSAKWGVTLGLLMMTITLSESAVKQLSELLEEKGASPEEGLRVFVEAGGCSGLQYGMRFDRRAEEDEVVAESGARVLIDAFSRKYLAGSTLDFVDGLTGAGFKILNPNAARSCGCGTSFEYAAQAGAAADHPSD